jgi:hypothetical protein
VVELAVNRAFTSLSYNGERVNRYGDGELHPGLGVTSDGKSSEGCITGPNSKLPLSFRQELFHAIP